MEKYNNCSPEERNSNIQELFDEMNKCNQTGQHKVAIIVFKSSNWPGKNYPEISRSYRSYSGQWGWDYSKMGNCRIGDCLDGTDNGVRLDYYNWEIESWYWEPSLNQNL